MYFTNNEQKKGAFTPTGADFVQQGFMLGLVPQPHEALVINARVYFLIICSNLFSF